MWVTSNFLDSVFSTYWSVEMIPPPSYNSYPAIPPQSPIKYKFSKFFPVTFMA